MSSLRPRHQLFTLVHILLLQVQLAKVQRIDPASHKLRRLNEQFQQFQALTQARLNMLAMNQNRNSSCSLEIRVQELIDHYHHMSQNLEHLKQSTTQEIEGLREWSRKLEKKNKRIEARLSLMERNMRNNHCYVPAEKPDSSQGLLNLTLEFQSQEERLAALQVQRDELLVGLKELQESQKIQALRVTQLEGQLSEVLQWNKKENARELGREEEPFSTAITPQEYHEPRMRTQTNRGGRPGKILGGHIQLRAEGTGQTRSDSRSQAKSYQYYLTKVRGHE